MNPKLFISHASEDKEVFVRPLADALKSRFEIWYDDYSLKLGDSLRASIDEGLRTSDFGIVVLSPRFFGKKWTQNELNGLFALEDTNRKIILPVWLDVTTEEVKAFSPVLADRRAVLAKHGLDRVVEEITVAVSVSTRAHDVLDASQGKKALAAALGIVTGRELDEKILRSEVGYGLFQQSLQRIENLVWERLSAYNLGKTQRFVRPAKSAHFIARGPHAVSVSIFATKVYLNSVRETKLCAVVHLEPSDFANREKREVLDEIEWRLTCVEEQKLGFRRDKSDRVESEAAVADAIVTLFAEQLAKRAKEAHND